MGKGVASERGGGAGETREGKGGQSTLVMVGSSEGEDTWAATLDRRVAATKDTRKRVREAEGRLVEAERAVAGARERVADAERKFEESLGNLNRFLGRPSPAPAPVSAPVHAPAHASVPAPVERGGRGSEQVPAFQAERASPSLGVSAECNGAVEEEDGGGRDDEEEGSVNDDEEEDEEEGEGSVGADGSTGRSLQCGYRGCGLTFKRPAVLREHMFVVHRGGSFHCDRCVDSRGKVMSTSAHLMVHLKQVHLLDHAAAKRIVQPQRDALLGTQ